MNGEEEPPQEESFSILVATDNHLGFAEKDPVRGDDSFVAFEEILQHAVNQKVDMILLGGDLFHDNKPSRASVHKATTLLRKYCFGDKPVQIEFLSDQKTNFATSEFPGVNYEDPNLNISIPVFSIHGNHDDPAGPQGLCALDMLSASGVINYFGKAPSLDEIVISPLLLRKGPTKLAIYGLGSVRDERLHRMFVNDKVKYLRPEQDQDEWFNVFVIHQNHVKRGTAATSFIPEDFLPDFIDMVIWGHEHDCIPELHLNETINAYILQPGSSVATSLSEGETLPKHCFKLQIWNKQFCMNKIPLTTVRPFIFKDVALPDDVMEEKDLHTFLQYHVDEMLERAVQLRDSNPNSPELPLLRLRYQYPTTTTPINGTKFGVEYVNRVANPRDVLLSSKRKEGSAGDSKAHTNNAIHEDDEDRKIKSPSALAIELLAGDNKQMNILLERSLSIACEDFVDKLENDSVSEYIDFAMEQCIKHLRTHSKPGEDLAEKTRIRKAVMSKEDANDDVEEARKRWEKRRLDKQARGETDDRDSDKDSDPELLDEDSKKSTRGRGRGRARARGASTRGARGSTRGTRGTKGKSQRGTLDVFMSGSVATSDCSAAASPSRVSNRSTKNTTSTKHVYISDSDE